MQIVKRISILSLSCLLVIGAVACSKRVGYGGSTGKGKRGNNKTNLNGKADKKTMKKLKH